MWFSMVLLGWFMVVLIVFYGCFYAVLWAFSVFKKKSRLAVS